MWILARFVTFAFSLLGAIGTLTALLAILSILASRRWPPAGDRWWIAEGIAMLLTYAVIHVGHRPWIRGCGLAATAILLVHAALPPQPGKLPVFALVALAVFLHPDAEALCCDPQPSSHERIAWFAYALLLAGCRYLSIPILITSDRDRLAYAMLVVTGSILYLSALGESRHRACNAASTSAA